LSAVCRVKKTPQRAFCLGAVSQSDVVPSVGESPKGYKYSELTVEKKNETYPKIGNRDIVGNSFHATVDYYDAVDYSLPSVRWAENTPEVLALRSKEAGSWLDLSLAEKKQLYRNSFRQTLAEVSAPKGEWKRQSYIFFYIMAISTAYFIWTASTGYGRKTTTTKEYQQEVVATLLMNNQGHYSGLSSKYDFEKNQWKK